MTLRELVESVEQKDEMAWQKAGWVAWSVFQCQSKKKLDPTKFMPSKIVREKVNLKKRSSREECKAFFENLNW